MEVRARKFHLYVGWRGFQVSLKRWMLTVLRHTDGGGFYELWTGRDSIVEGVWGVKQRKWRSEMMGGGFYG